jgi:uncharacterized protein YcfJ
MSPQLVAQSAEPPWARMSDVAVACIAQDVQRCRDVSSGRPEYWDVTYRFNGQEHTVQMSAPPGRTILVNRDGEPRV